MSTNHDSGSLSASERLHQRAVAALERAVRAGAPRYARKRDLPRLIRVAAPAELEETEAAVVKVVARLKRALRGERNRARNAHWTYDLNRHIALRQAYSAETARLERLRDRICRSGG